MSRYLATLAAPLAERDRLEWFATRVLGLPFARRFGRWRAARESPSHPLRGILDSLDRR